MTPELLRMLRSGERDEVTLESVPYARFMNFSLRHDGARIFVRVGFDPRHIGAPGRYHGGVIGAALEFAAMAELMWRLLDTEAEMTTMPRPVTLTVDFLRAARAQDLHAAADIARTGRRMASVRARAWQEDETRPNAEAQMHFLLRR